MLPLAKWSFPEQYAGAQMRGDSLRVVVGSVGSKDNVTISFAERFSRSEQFDQIFREGMSLVEATAGYLDGAGRKAAKGLTPSLAVVYATESMRLTTRLLELASWLIVRRSLKHNEITAEEALVKRRRIKLGTVGRPQHVKGYVDLPEGLRELIEKSFALNDRILLLDRALDQPPVAIVKTAEPNPVALQVDALAKAFDTRH